MSSYIFTSESVCAGHPDKICDQISDAVVDAALEVNKQARVAVEVGVKESVFMIGEVTCKKVLNYKSIARKVIKDLGYVGRRHNFSDESHIEVQIKQQSGDIAMGVDDGGAGDQGLMFGYACCQTPELMPLPIVLAHKLTRGMDELMDKYDLLRPDGKSQVTVRYEGRKLVKVEKVILAKPHDQGVSVREVKDLLKKEVVDVVLSGYGCEVGKEQIIVNGTGKWEIGGPASDSGVTGRKIIVDTYGGWSRHGGGCFSGKDATKVDRSGAYMARWAAKKVVDEGLADECEIQVAYVIGGKEPVSVMVETFGTGKETNKYILDHIKELTDFSVADMMDKLDLRKPVFQQTVAYGHFGREGFVWEEV